MRWSTKYTNFLMKFYPVILVVTGVMAMIGLFYSAKLYSNLRTDLEELLPESAQSVIDVKEVSKRVGGFNHLSVVIESPNPDAGFKFQQDLAAEMRKLPPTLVARVEDNILRERAFFERYKALYMDIEDWRALDTYVTERIRIAKSKLKRGWFPFVRKGAQPVEEEEPKFDFKALEEKYEKRAGEVDRFPDGYFRSSNGYTSIVLAFLPGKVTDQKANERLFNATKEIVERLNPKRYDRQMVVGYNGDVSNMIEEHEGLIEDLELSTVVVLVLVAVSMWLYFRTIAGVYALCAALFCGTLVTFGVSYATVGYLNANTAFLGSIVLGNGINFGIIFLARYIEERRKKISVREALRRTIEFTIQATWVASMAAGVAYGSLIVTDFRGFNQFGVIGGLGMVFCWLATFTVLPGLLILFERFQWVRIDTGHAQARFVKPVSDFVMTHYKNIVWGTLASVVVAGALCFKFGPDTLESDFSKLRNKRSLESGSGYWSRKVDAVFDRYLTPSVVVTSTPEEAQAVAKKLNELKAKEGDASPISDIKVIEDFLPKDQAEKIAITNHIRSLLTPEIMRHMRPRERARVGDFLPEPGQLKELTVADLPDGIKVHFRELDGTMGRLVHVYPRLQTGKWDGNEVINFANQMRTAIRESGIPLQNAAIAGQAPLSADMIASIAHDGPKATIWAFAAVALLVILVFRNLPMITMVLSALCLGVLWMAGVMAFYDMKINFLNFIALPITFGIGVDYAVNIVSRYASDLKSGGGARIEDAIEHTGGAVALCSWTTIIGYGSLLLAGSQAFVSFGLLSVLGELACLPAALVALPAFWRWRHEREERRRSGRVSTPTSSGGGGVKHPDQLPSPSERPQVQNDRGYAAQKSEPTAQL